MKRFQLQSSTLEICRRGFAFSMECIEGVRGETYGGFSYVFIRCKTQHIFDWRQFKRTEETVMLHTAYWVSNKHGLVNSNGIPFLLIFCFPIIIEANRILTKASSVDRRHCRSFNPLLLQEWIWALFANLQWNM